MDFTMIKNKAKLFFLISLMASSLSTASVADIISIEIGGKGTINASEASITCDVNCIIENDLPLNTLIATPKDNGSFYGWTGQMCDFGDQLIVNETESIITRTTGGSKTLVSADINGDGFIDLASIQLFNGKVTTLINDGSGEFKQHVVVTNLNYPTALAFYDWDNDGDQDLAVAEFGSSKIKLFYNNGNGGMEFNRDIIIEGVMPYSISITDINSDKQPDLIISSFTADTSGDLFQLVNSIKNENTSLYVNDNNNFTVMNKLSDTAAMTLDSYLQEDSEKLIVVAAEIIKGDVALYTIDKKDVIRTLVDSVGASYGVAFGDVDNNGLIDILASYYRPSILGLYYNQGNNTFSAMHTITRKTEGLTATSIADFNNDGYDDLATGEFNSDKFYYFPTKSYKDCIIEKGSNISLMATFSQASQPQEVIVPNSESASGGSISLFILLSILSCMFIRVRYT
ncbi:Integrins alpha chain [Shewanella denitrificans OS217]|uniref:Integrins alpha chain n=2 Tax=Shewanella TaxID=22 RepID=Q12IY2_SHEDO|nr:VCBS repeat-containing protein [Shewanella denitrificans]ABE56594.1 Integrins alpha chain [Shewanella denitrificans OS217]